MIDQNLRFGIEAVVTGDANDREARRALHCDVQS